MKPPALAICVLVVMSTGFPSGLARAAFDPGAADVDARALIKSNDYGFCTKPDHRLSHNALRLCPLAGEIQGCSALVVACEGTPPEPSKLDLRWLDRLAKLIGLVAPYLAWGFAGTLLVLVAYLVVRAVRAARDDDVPVVPTPQSDVTVLADTGLLDEVTAAEALLSRAAEARVRGDRRAALLHYLAAALRALDDRGAIRIARDRTNGEYVRSCRDTALRPSLRDLVRDVDNVEFGGFDATSEAVTLAQSRAERIVRMPGIGAARLVAGATMAISTLR